MLRSCKWNVPQYILRQLYSNRNIDEGVRAITEVREHLDQPLSPPSSSRSGGSEFEVFRKHQERFHWASI
ncbi:unnamed protein product [Victoria cruziana]